MRTILSSEALLHEQLRAASAAARQRGLEALATGESDWAHDLDRDTIGLGLLAHARTPGARFLGVSVPAEWRDHNGVLHFHYEESRPGSLWQVVSALGLLLQQEARYESKPFTFPEFGDYLACLWVADGRAVGVLVYFKDDDRYCWLDEIDESEWEQTPVHGYHTYMLCISGAWVARDYRKRGIAKDLVLAAASKAAIESSRMMHAPPFTTEGVAFARSVSGGRVKIPAIYRGRLYWPPSG